MSLPEIVSRDEWLHARVALLEQEKALTKARDALAAERRRLPMVEVTEDYRFTAADGNMWTLLDIFEGRHQLIIDHYMFDPSWDEGCMSCAGRVDQYGNIEHLHERDTTIAVVSRAPIEKIERFKRKMGWTFPWYSSFGSRFNFDFGVSFDATVENPTYNYRTAAEWEAQGMPAPAGELHGTSVFLRDGDRVFHTYSGLWAWHRASWRHTLLSRHDRTWSTRRLGGAKGTHGFVPPACRSAWSRPDGWPSVTYMVPKLAPNGAQLFVTTHIWALGTRTGDMPASRSLAHRRRGLPACTGERQ